MALANKRKTELYQINEALVKAEYLLFEANGLQAAFEHVGEALQEISGEIALIENHEQMEED